MGRITCSAYIVLIFLIHKEFPQINKNTNLKKKNSSRAKVEKATHRKLKKGKMC